MDGLTGPSECTSPGRGLAAVMSISSLSWGVSFHPSGRYPGPGRSVKPPAAHADRPDTLDETVPQALESVESARQHD
ncbi:hypothetical protein GCM10023214_64210 [Amycolatopsis dongchuanensis]|uniref:Uncharacterized protein n=1 Tax=Amycolatopsis dongchuanensis TaxID=1070866 RepID=A0ABP8VGN7_9PSEU